MFVFRFGYESPEQSAANAAHGWDDESSQWVVIDAPDAAAALAWGREIAERFVQELGAGSWITGTFAHWIEPLSACPWAVGREPVVCGQFPDFSVWA
jgi:hypothetical protein